MGRPQPEPYRDDPDSEAVSLHTTPDDYAYNDAPEITGLPPSYADSEGDSSSAALSQTHIRHIPPPTTRTDHNNPKFKNGRPVVCDTITHMDPACDKDPDTLQRTVTNYSYTAPTPLIYIMGTHWATVKNGGKEEKKEITDFRIVINMQRYLFKDFDPKNLSSMGLVTVENGTKTHRGTVFKCRAPGVKQDLEVSGPVPTLTEWCHRYCASPRMLRIFRLQRVIPGFDEKHLEQRLEGLVRATNYRGHIKISFPIEDKNVDFYTSNWVNRWRTTPWICWIFYLTFLWIFTWPILYFTTKRYAVVRAEWPFAWRDADGRRSYTTISEDQWFDKWHVAIRRLVLDQYQGEASEGMMQGVIARPADPDMPGNGFVNTGHAGLDNAVGILSQGIQIARAVQNGGNLGRGMQGGWGYDT